MATDEQMTWTVAGMTRQEYFQGPFWMSLRYAAAARPVILGISDGSDERADYAMLSAKFGEYYQFLLLNESALEACKAAKVRLTILGEIEYDDLTAEPSLILGSRPVRRSA